MGLLWNCLYTGKILHFNKTVSLLRAAISFEFGTPEIESLINDRQISASYNIVKVTQSPFCSQNLSLHAERYVCQGGKWRCRQVVQMEGRVIPRAAQRYLHDTATGDWLFGLAIPRYNLSWSQLKLGNAHCEQMLRAVELLLSIALSQPSVGQGDPPGREHLLSIVRGVEAQWKMVLLGQFHDVLPGSSIELVSALE